MQETSEDQSLYNNLKDLFFKKQWDPCNILLFFGKDLMLMICVVNALRTPLMKVLLIEAFKICIIYVYMYIYIIWV